MATPRPRGEGRLFGMPESEEAEPVRLRERVVGMETRRREMQGRDEGDPDRKKLGNKIYSPRGCKTKIEEKVISG